MLVSCTAAQAAPDFVIPPLRAAIDLNGQPVSIAISGRISAWQSGAAAMFLEAGLGDLQRQLLPILQAQWKQDNRCGERVTLLDATLTPEPPSARLVAHLHFEKWGCAKAFGKEITKKLVAGNAAVEARLTPAIAAPAGVRFQAEILTLDADGQLGEVLRSGSFGDALREKIRRTLAEDMEKAARFAPALPPALRDAITLESARFARRGPDELCLQVDATARLDAGQFRELTRR